MRLNNPEMKKARRSPLKNLLLMASFVLPTKTIQPQAQSADVINDPEAYAVYAAVLPIRPSSGDKRLTNVALLQETRAVTHCPREDAIQPEWRSVVDSYRNENSRVRVLRQGFDLGVPYDLVTVAELTTLMQGAGYDFSSLRITGAPGFEVFRRFPGGKLFTVSAVGFNPEKTRAMVTLQADCFPSEIQTPNQTYHEGRQLMLEKQDGRWVIKGDGCYWIA